MATVKTFNSFTAAINNGVHDLAADTLKFCLTDTAPDLANAQFSDLAEIAAGNGYTAGGESVTVTSSSQTGGTYSLALASCVFTASGGPIGPFRYIVLYNDTAANKELIGFVDYGVSYTLPDGQPFTMAAGTFYSLA